MINNRFGTLCFLPSDNLDIVCNTLNDIVQALNQDWRCLVITVESQQSLKSYQKIRKLCEKSALIDHLILKDKWGTERLVPIAFKVLSAIQFVKTSYITFLNEDLRPDFKGLGKLVQLLKEEKDISAIKGRVLPSNCKQADLESDTEYQWHNAGKGINEFGLKSFSSTGLIYSVNCLKESGILDRFETNLLAHRDYPFIYLNLLLAAKRNTVSTPEIVCSKVEIQLSTVDKMSNYFSHRSYGRRCDQLIALRNTLFEALLESETISKNKKMDIAEFYDCYIQLCSQLVSIIMTQQNVGIYTDQMMNIDLIAKSFSIFCLSAVEQFPDYIIYEETLRTKIVAATKQAIATLDLTGVATTEDNKDKTSSLFYTSSQVA